MTREHKLALIIGFSLVLVVGVLISDHFSKARSAQVATEITPGSAASFGNGANGLRIVSAANPVLENGPTIIAPPGGLPPHAAGLSGPSGALPPTTEPVPPSSVGMITMNEPLPGNAGSAAAPGRSLLDRTVTALGNTSALASDVQVPATSTGAPAGGVIPINPTSGTLASRDVPSAVPAHAAPAAASAREDLINGVPRAMMRRHDVREGESIYRIAENTYGDGALWPKLVEFNKGKVSATGAMRQGVTLLLPPKEALLGKPLPAMVEPAGEAGGGTVAPKNPPKPARPAFGEKPERMVASAKTYTVQKGDSLSDIAKRTLGSSRRWNEIVDLNKDVLDDEHTLVVGLTLKLPTR